MRNSNLPSGLLIVVALAPHRGPRITITFSPGVRKNQVARFSPFSFLKDRALPHSCSARRRPGIAAVRSFARRAPGPYHLPAANRAHLLGRQIVDAQQSEPPAQ